MEKDGKIAYFNILRFIGAICISVLFHYRSEFLIFEGLGNPFPSNPFLFRISVFGGVFVSMFFIMSGILFTFVYRRKIENGMLFDDFIIKRIIRLWPLIIITCVFMYIINCILYFEGYGFWEYGTEDIFYLFVNMIFGGGNVFGEITYFNASIWYLNILLICYILAYILTQLSIKYKSKCIYFLPIFIGFMMLFSDEQRVLWNHSVYRGFTGFFMGVILGFIFSKFNNLAPRYMLIIKCVVALELFCVVLFIKTFGYMSDIHFYYTFLIFPEVLILFYNCRYINKICSGKVITFLGNISFGIYMWNFPIYISWHYLYVKNRIPFSVTSHTFVFINLLTHIIVAAISYCLIDKKLCRLLNQLYSKRRA